MSSSNQEKRRQTTVRADGVKRFRVSRACDQCRTAREKCDGKQPVCTPCLDTRRTCAYTSNPKKRGLQPGYIRSLEMTLAFIFQHNPEVEYSVYSQLAHENTALLARGTKESNRLHKSWSKSRFCRDVTKALSGEQIGVSDNRSPSSDEESEVDMEDVSLLQMPSNPRSQQSVSLSCLSCKHALIRIDILDQRYELPTTRHSYIVITRPPCLKHAANDRSSFRTDTVTS
jgi:hypothetical protein